MGMIITRVWYCPFCEKKGRPELDDLFVVIGRTQEKFQVHKAIMHTNRFHKGYTPHLVQILKYDRLRSTVKISITCAMNHCGLHLEKVDDGYDIYFDKVTEMEVPLKEWNKIVQFTDTGYELD